MPEPFDILAVIKKAVRLCRDDAADDDRPPGVFTSGAFAFAVRAEFGLKELPDDAWCSRVLMDDDRVVRHRGRGSWRLLGTPIGRETPC